MSLTQVPLGMMTSDAQYTGFKNRIINGGMVIDQRNAGASFTPANLGYGGPDRWSFLASQASKFSGQQNLNSVTPPTGFTKYLGYSVTSAVTVGASDYFASQQLIEGFNCADLGWGTASAQPIAVSFWVRSSLTGTFNIAVGNASFGRGYSAVYTINSANTWEYKTITIPGDTSGTWPTDNTASLRLCFNLGAGSSASVAAGSWGAWVGVGATGAVSLVGTLGATFYITGVQLEKGSNATAFDYRPYGTELALCQRYFETFGGGTNDMLPGSGTWGSPTTAVISLVYTVQKRAAPTMSYVGTVGSFEAVNEGVGWRSATSISFAGSGTKATEMAIGTTSGGSQGMGARFRVTSASAFAQASAEL